MVRQRLLVTVRSSVVLVVGVSMLGAATAAYSEGISAECHFGGFRQWTDKFGRTAVGKLISVNADNTVTIVKHEDGKVYRTDFERLSMIDQEWVKSSGQERRAGNIVREREEAGLLSGGPHKARFVAIQSTRYDHVDDVMTSDDLVFGEAPTSMDDPSYRIEEKTFPVRKWVSEERWIWYIERYGFRGRCWRTVYRKRIIWKPVWEERTRTQESEVPSLRGRPGTALRSQDIVLDAPRTAGAIPDRIAKALNAVFPAQDPRFKLIDRRINASAVDFRSFGPLPKFNGTNGVIDVQVRIDINALDPRRVVLVVVARDNINPANSADEADGRLAQIAPLLVQKP